MQIHVHDNLSKLQSCQINSPKLLHVTTATVHICLLWVVKSLPSGLKWPVSAFLLKTLAKFSWNIQSCTLCWQIRLNKYFSYICSSGPCSSLHKITKCCLVFCSDNTEFLQKWKGWHHLTKDMVLVKVWLLYLGLILHELKNNIIIINSIIINSIF